jgi:AraC-like DNA-binding protein
MSPKVFARLVRFSKAYRMRENFDHLSWTSIAHDCGYFDQMHFIRDFKEFAGVAPGILERELQELPVRLQAGLRF